MGEWIYQGSPEVYPWKCSKCQNGFDLTFWDKEDRLRVKKWRFCPLCGERMEWPDQQKKGADPSQRTTGGMPSVKNERSIAP